MTERQKYMKEYNDKYFKKPKGLVKKIYHHIRRNAKHRNHTEPDFTYQELFIWITSQNNFKSIYEVWQNNDYHKNYTPSVDRLDNNLSYTLKNIQLTSWNQNKKNADMDTRNKKIYNSMLLNGGHRSVIQIDLDLNIVNEYISLAEASRQNKGFLHQGISDCLNNKRTLYKGFFWIDKKNKDDFVGSITNDKLKHIKKRYKSGFVSDYKICINNKTYFCRGYREACSLLNISYPTLKKWINNEPTPRTDKPNNFKIKEI